MVYNITEILEKGSCDITSVKDLAIRLYTAYEVYIPTLWLGCRCDKVLPKSTEFLCKLANSQPLYKKWFFYGKKCWDIFFKYISFGFNGLCFC